MTDSELNELREALADRYRIEGPLGQGGMATVYLAADLRHGRRVAIKVLKPEISALVGAERFLSEIRTTAGLHHPHILQLFDSGEAAGRLFYVMPRVEGESLRERLKRERQLPVDEAVALATKVARALDHAHRAGVVHRDVKPANILLAEGEPLVADFGIALAVGMGEGGRLTETGLTMGTPHYMAPEQATGDQPVGPSADIYALGCVLYECLVGDRPFGGSTTQAVLGNILTKETPSATQERPSVPAHVDAAIHTALERVPADRFRSALDFAAALADTGYRHGPAPENRGDARARLWRSVAAAAGMLALVASTLAVVAYSGPSREARRDFRVPVRFADDQALAGTGHFDLARDGSILVYQGVAASGQTQLWARRANAVDATPIAGTEGLSPGVVPDIAISPDGEDVVFYRAGSFHVVPITGGAPREVADSIWGTARWSPDGAWIYMRRLPWPGIVRVPSGGGTPEIVTTPDTARRESGHVWPEVLPDGASIVFEARSPDGPMIKGKRPGSDEMVEIVAGRYPRYSQGRLLFMSPDGGSVLAAPFDADGMRLEGEAELVVDGLPETGSTLTGSFGYAVSDDGILAYSPQRSWDMMWVSSDGAQRPVDPDWELEDSPSSWVLAPDGSRVAFRVGPAGEGDVWLKDLDEGPQSPVTSLPGEERPAAWLDRETLLVLMEGETGLDAYAIRADGAGEPRLLYDHETAIAGASVGGDGASMAFFTGIERFSAEGPVGGDLYSFSLVNGGPATLLLETSGYAIGSVALHPSGDDLAYHASPTRRTEVFLRPFPDVEGGRTQVSVAGGVDPHWSADGSKLFYVNARREMVEAEITPGSPLRVTRRTLFELGHEFSSLARAAPDGSFLMARSEPELVLVFGWRGESE